MDLELELIPSKDRRCLRTGIEAEMSNKNRKGPIPEEIILKETAIRIASMDLISMKAMRNLPRMRRRPIATAVIINDIDTIMTILTGLTNIVDIVHDRGRREKINEYITTCRYEYDTQPYLHG